MTKPWRTVEDWMEDPLIDKIARVAYTAIREWCLANDLPIAGEWKSLSTDYQSHIRIVVARRFSAMENLSGKELHTECLQAALNAGWGYSDKMDTLHRKHPDVQPWDKLTFEQRTKDHLMSQIIRTFLEGS